jgi:multidrug efflux pump subunit AcrB
VISISVSLIAVFIPVLLMGGLVGLLLREFAITVSIAILMSAFISLSLTPMMCARMLRDPRGQRHGRLYHLSGSGFAALLAMYEAGLRWALRHRWVTLATTWGTIALAGYLYIVIPKGFFPQQDTGFVIEISEAAQNISYPAMLELQSRAADLILRDPAVSTVNSTVGNDGSNPAVNNGRLLINLKPHDQRDVSAFEVNNRLRPKIAQLQGINVFLQVSQDITVGARFSRTQFQYTLQDSDLDELDHWAPILLRELQRLPQLRDVATDQQIAGPTVRLEINRDAASRRGVPLQAIDDTIYDAFGQRKIVQFFTQQNNYWVVLEVDPRFQLDPNALDLLYVGSTNGGQVPLSALVERRRTVRSLTVNHQGQFPAITLSFNLAPEAALGQAVDAINQIKSRLNVPDTLITTFQGNAQAFQDSLRTQPLLILASVIAVYPSAGVGALLTLMAFHFDLNIVGIIAILLLIGIVKKNGIMMVDFALEAERTDGLSPEEAIYHAAVLRFRPIMMTTFAALFGAIPLALGSGAGAEIRQPLGYAIVGGLLVSQFLTLFTTPVVYLALDRLRPRRPARGLAAEPSPEPQLAVLAPTLPQAAVSTGNAPLYPDQRRSIAQPRSVCYNF